jgi:hypothetical protein
MHERGHRVERAHACAASYDASRALVILVRLTVPGDSTGSGRHHLATDGTREGRDAPLSLSLDTAQHGEKKRVNIAAATVAPGRCRQVEASHKVRERNRGDWGSSGDIHARSTALLNQLQQRHVRQRRDVPFLEQF